jgi:glycerol-3-phosphate acyltransferase PlsY
MEYAIIILLAYLLGSSNMAFYLSKWKKVDIRKSGSGNLGTSNATILLGLGPGVVVGIHDIGKAAVAVLLAEFFFPQLEYAGAVAGVACVMGHIFPFYLRFKGGKGFAPYLGMTLAMNWKLALVVLVLVVLVTLITDYLVLGTMTTIVVVPAAEMVFTRSAILLLILLVATVTIFFRHWDNFGRLRNGTEIRLRDTKDGRYKITK